MDQEVNYPREDRRTDALSPHKEHICLEYVENSPVKSRIRKHTVRVLRFDVFVRLSLPDVRSQQLLLDS